MRADLWNICREQRQIFRNPFTKFIHFSRIRFEVREGELLGLVFELKLGIRASEGEP
jgi:hypothetical protein